MGNKNGRRNPWRAANELSGVSASVNVSVCGGNAFVSINVPKRKGLWPAFMLLLHRTRLTILSATLSSTPDGSDFHSIHAEIPQEVRINDKELQKMFEDIIYEELGVQACKA